jgi:hypothetical protein
MHFRLKVPSGEYGSIFVAFKMFFVMPAFHFMQLMNLQRHGYFVENFLDHLFGI